MEKILTKYNEDVQVFANKQVEAEWNVATDVGNESLIEILVKLDTKSKSFIKLKVSFFTEQPNISLRQI